jgi:hypothetical protein
MKDEEGDSIDCESCGYPAYDVQTYTRLRPDATNGKTKHLCGLCASTHTGTGHEYPSHYPGTEVMKVVCYVGNVILEELRKATPTARDDNNERTEHG